MPGKNQNNQGSYSNQNKRQSYQATARCSFTGRRDLMSNMIRSTIIDKENPIYFSSDNAFCMWKHLHGIVPIVHGTPEESHNYYMETLKTCYPGIYKRQFGDDKKSNYNHSE